jgi:DNA-binding PadR family transcriptional regulator
MAKRKVTNPLALAVLAFLVMGPMHPYELGRRLTETGKDKDIKFNRGSLYMVMEQLRKAGFVVAQETVRDTQRPERTVYALTDDGRTELYDWLGQLVSDPAHEYPQFGVALSLLSVLKPNDAADLLTRRLAALTAELDELGQSVRTATDGGLPWVFVVEDNYRLAMLETESRFVAELVESLNQPDYVKAWQEQFGGGATRS